LAAVAAAAAAAAAVADSRERDPQARGWIGRIGKIDGWLLVESSFNQVFHSFCGS